MARFGKIEPGQSYDIVYLCVYVGAQMAGFPDENILYFTTI